MRRLDEYRFSQAGPLENDLVDELAEGGDGPPGVHPAGDGAGAVGRRDRLGARRLRHAARVRRTDGRAKAGGRLRVGIIPPPRRSSSPTPTPTRAASTTGGIAGEFLTRATQTLTLKPELALSWKPNANATRVDVQAAARRQVPERAELQRRRRRRDLQAARRPERRLAGALRVQGRALARQASRRSTTSRRVPPRRADGELPLPDELDDLPGDHPADELQARHVHEDAADDGRLPAHVVHPGGRRQVRPQPGWWGGTAPLDGVDVTYYSDDAAVIVGAAREARSTSSARSSSRRAGRCSATRTSRSSPPAARRTGRCRCGSMLKQPAQETARAPGDRADARPAGDRQDAVQQVRRRRQRLAVRARLPVHGQERAAAQKDLAQAKQLMAQAGLPEGLQDHAHDREDGEIPQLAQIIQRSVKAIGINMKLDILTLDGVLRRHPGRAADRLRARRRG